MVIVAAFMLVFVLLMFLYERFAIPRFSIVAMPMLAMPAVFLALWLTGIELNISAMMGMTMVVGIVTEVAISFFSNMNICPTTASPRPRRFWKQGANRSVRSR